MKTDLSQDIRNRTFAFAGNAARVSLGMSTAPGARRLVDQLVRACTSVGANLEEAKAASTRRDFVHHVQISLREAREAKYWLRLCCDLRLAPIESLEPLIDEADQLSRILGAIVVTSKRRTATG